jgi:RNA polymerase sigma-70 factor, ECF subfamily
MTLLAMFTETEFVALISRHQAGVWRYLRLLGCESALADDLTQETFLAVLEEPFDDYAPAASAAYLRTIARRKFAQHCERNRVKYGDLDAAESVWAEIARDDSGQAQLEALDHCLEKLAPRTRKALELRYASQASREDIAREIGLSEDGAKNLIQRAKEALRECIERRMSNE